MTAPKTGKCILCGQEYSFYGNNPAPLSETGRACDYCNQVKVIPARLGLLKKRENGGKND